MAKLDVALSGNSGHVHQSVADGSGKNLFSDGKGGLSDLARHYLAGVVATLPEFTAFFCPTVNSYKRTVEKSWAGVSATWATENRTTAVRAVVSSTSATRIENRLPGADANPHVVVAACVAAGRYGMAEKLEPPEPSVGNAYEIPEDVVPRLPRSLDHAVELLDKSAVNRLGTPSLPRNNLADR
jgi:glutamine synthetase